MQYKRKRILVTWNHYIYRRKSPQPACSILSQQASTILAPKCRNREKEQISRAHHPSGKGYFLSPGILHPWRVWSWGIMIHQTTDRSVHIEAEERSIEDSVHHSNHVVVRHRQINRFVRPRHKRSETTAQFNWCRYRLCSCTNLNEQFI